MRNDAAAAAETVRLLRAQVDGTLANTALTEAQRSMIELQTQEAYLSMVTGLMDEGNVALVQELAPQLLEGIIPDAERRDAVVADLITMTQNTRDADDRVTRANVIIAEVEADVAQQTKNPRIQQEYAAARGADADADFARWQADTAAARREFDEWAVREGLRVQWGQVNRMTSAGGAGGASAYLDPSDTTRIKKEIRDGSNYAWEDLQTDVTSAMETFTRLGEIGMAIQGGTWQELEWVTERYGSNPQVSPEALQASVEADYQVARERALIGMQGFISDWLSVTGGALPSPDQLGIVNSDVGMALYEEAIMRYPWARQAEADEEATTAALRDQVFNVAVGVAGDSVTAPIAADQIYEGLLDETTTEEDLAAAGIDRAYIADVVQEQTEEYQGHVARAEEWLTPLGVDWRNPEDRQDALYSQGRAMAVLNQAQVALGEMPMRGEVPSWIGGWDPHNPEQLTYTQASSDLVDKIVDSGIITREQLLSSEFFDASGGLIDRDGLDRWLSARWYEMARGHEALRWLDQYHSVNPVDRSE
jgi:hypothetical protein